MGTGISDYLDIPVAMGRENECMKLIHEYLLEIKSQWDICDFQELRNNSPFFKEISGMYRTYFEPCSLCVSKIIGSNPGKIIYMVPKKLRNNLRRSEEKLLKNGKINFYEENSDGLKSALEQLIFLHSVRWNDKQNAGVLNEKNIQDFHFDVSERLYKKDMMRIFSLKFDDKVIASYYVFLHRKTAYAYLGGFDPGMSEYSPGTISLYYCMLSLATKGYECIDFLRGEEAYKLHWRVEKKINYSVKILTE
jgi:hypothetical protein